jgi:lipopolysaccharide biosynthesis glycosyltransferase
VEKALYLDSDIVVRKNIIDLWRTDISNHPLGAVCDMGVDDIRTYNRLDFDVDQRYYNAGVLLMNLYYWRKHKISKKCLALVDSQSERLKWWDQDLLNILLGKEIKALPFTYNMQDTFFREDPMLQQKYLNEIKDCLDAPAIVHYSTEAKPWFKETDHPFKKEYYYYLSFTPWKNYKPRFRNRKTKLKYYLKKIYQ